MDLLKVMERFPTQEACVEHLEQVRWGKNPPYCPHCGSTGVGRRTESEVGRIGLELPRLPCLFQSDVWHGVSRHKNPASEVVSCDCSNNECQEKSVQSPIIKGLGLKSKDRMVYYDAYTI